MLLYGLHEMLEIIGRVCRGEIFLNAMTQTPLQLPGEVYSTLCATIFYYNDSMIIFEACMREINLRGDILHWYGIPANVDLTSFWRIGTPEALSGEDAMFVQVFIMPRSTKGADLRGNMADEGRLTVSLTRGQRLVMLHLDEACLRDPGAAQYWNRLKHVVEHRTEKFSSDFAITRKRICDSADPQSFASFGCQRCRPDQTSLLGVH